jgi:hypothetical protein
LATFSGENEEALGSRSIDPGAQGIIDLRLGPGRALHARAPTGLNSSIQPRAIALGEPIAKHNQAPEKEAKRLAADAMRHEVKAAE